MKNSAKAILVHRAYGQTEVILFNNDAAFYEMCEFLEASNAGFDVASNVITCLGKGPAPKKKAKLKAVKK